MTRSLRSFQMALLEAPAAGAGLGLSVVGGEECTTGLLETN